MAKFESYKTEDGRTYLTRSVCDNDLNLTCIVEVIIPIDDQDKIRLAPGQRWTPTRGKKEKARDIARFQYGPAKGVPSLLWSEYWPSCGFTDDFTISSEVFSDWVRETEATCSEVENRSRYRGTVWVGISRGNQYTKRE